MFSVQLFTFIYKTRVFTFNKNIINQFAFYTNDRINRHNARVANAAHIVNFDILRDDENDIDSSFDSLQIAISVKRVLKNIIATINNQFSKKRRKRFSNTKSKSRKSRFDLFSRVDFNVLSYVSRRFDFVVIFSRNVKRASKRIAERMKRAIKQKQKIEQSNQKNEVDWIKKTFEKLNDDEFVRIFQFDTFSLSQSIESTSISSFESISINKNVRRRNERRRTRRRDKRSLNLNWMKIKTSNDSFSVYTLSNFRIDENICFYCDVYQFKKKCSKEDFVKTYWHCCFDDKIFHDIVKSENDFDALKIMFDDFNKNNLRVLVDAIKIELQNLL